MYTVPFLVLFSFVENYRNQSRFAKLSQKVLLRQYFYGPHFRNMDKLEGYWYWAERIPYNGVTVFPRQRKRGHSKVSASAQIRSLSDITGLYSKDASNETDTDTNANSKYIKYYFAPAPNRRDIKRRCCLSLSMKQALGADANTARWLY